MFAKYYQSELTYLREMGRAFSQAHPATAQMLGERGGDPDVERLLEGFAFIAAQIRERVDDAVPDIVHHLVELLLPHYVRPVPATSIVQFLPSLRTLRGAAEIPLGTPLSSVERNGTQCSFRTTNEIELLPIELTGVHLDESKASRPKLRLRFDTTAAGPSLIGQAGKIRFHIHGEQPLAATLLLWFMRHCDKITVQPTGEEPGAPVSIDPSKLHATGFDPDNELLPWPENSPQTYRPLLEYFTLPDKFMFFEVRGLEGLDFEDESFDLVFEFDSPPQLPDRVNDQCFRLHCTPVINLFEDQADPIKLDRPLQDELIRVSGFPPEHVEIYEIQSVIGLEHGRQRQRDYASFFSFSHQPGVPYYSLRFSQSPLDQCVDTRISLLTPKDEPHTGTGETLSVKLTCTNRLLPNELTVGDISVPARGTPTSATFRNITPVTSPVRVGLGSELHWKLLSHLALNHQGLASASTLRDTLSLYNFSSQTQPQVAHANQQLISSIRNVDAKPVTRLMGGAPVRGAQTKVELEESTTGSLGQAYVFGCILNELYASHVSLNSFNELKVELHPSDRSFRWKPRIGRRQKL